MRDTDHDMRAGHVGLCMMCKNAEEICAIGKENEKGREVRVAPQWRKTGNGTDAPYQEKRKKKEAGLKGKHGQRE
jgi:hypothetical protein